MNCNDAKKLIPALALDDIDVEERREIDKHLEGCAVCRAERDALAKVHGAVKSTPEVETSQSRRDAVVGAMASARAEVLQRAAVTPPRWNLLWAAAAAIVLAITSFVAFGPSLFAPTYRIASGTGVIIKQDGTVPITPNAVVRRGDRIVAEAVRLEGTDVVIDVTGTLSLQPGEFLLEQGTMTVDVRRGEVVVTDVSRDRLVLRAGRFEVRIERSEGAVGSGTEPVKKESAWRLSGRVLEGSARLEGENGQVELKAGEKGKLDPRGYPDRKKE